VSDTGIVFGKTLGTAKVYATVDGHTDSASITVTAPITTPPPRDTGTTQPAPVATFSLAVEVRGVVQAADTTLTEPVAGATVRAIRVLAVNGDTLNPSLAAGTAVTNANGMVTFSSLPGGGYTILATPPAGSRYQT